MIALSQQDFKSLALQFFTIPSSYELVIEDIRENISFFLWKDAVTDEGYSIEFNGAGKLLSLSQPFQPSELIKPVKELQTVAEQFLMAQYPQALDYFTLTKVKPSETGMSFRFEQLVGGLPLESHYCVMTVAMDGQIIECTINPYTENPPTFPSELATKEDIVAKLAASEWTASLGYASDTHYTVPQNNLYVFYESPMLYHSFNAQTGEDLLALEDEEIKESEIFLPLPTVASASRLQTIEEIVGITASMEVIRQKELDEETQGIVWREKTYEQSTGKTMEQFIKQRVEQSVKATIDPSTKQLKGFIWFKERIGELQLTSEACLQQAVTFLTTYYPDYLPYLQLKVDEDTMNEQNKSFFHFQLFIDSYCLEGEFFEIAVNQTTGLIDVLMTPEISLETLDMYELPPLLPMTKALESLQQVEVALQWQASYEDDVPEQLIYKIISSETKQFVKGIDASTGKLIAMID